jgi:hypothetical protein
MGIELPEGSITQGLVEWRLSWMDLSWMDIQLSEGWVALDSVKKGLGSTRVKLNGVKLREGYVLLGLVNQEFS